MSALSIFSLGDFNLWEVDNTKRRDPARGVAGFGRAFNWVFEAFRKVFVMTPLAKDVQYHEFYVQSL